MLTTFLSSLLISMSVTISPLGVTYHLIPVPPTPHHILKNNELTYHPEIAIKLEWEHWQIDTVYLHRDTFGRPAGALMGGYKWDLIKDRLSLGAVLGIYVRQAYGGDSPPTIYHSARADVIPMFGASAAYTQPITHRIGLELNMVATPILIHAVIGPKFSF